MKLMIASDIHGSSLYCEELLKRYNDEKPDKLLLLGDILYHGPRNDLPCGYNPKSVIAMLNNIKDEIICVRGNCDAEVDQMVLDFPIMADYSILDLDGRLIFATHGHIYNENNLPPMGRCDVLLNGHTHIPKCVSHGDYTYMNPGSVSIPKEGSRHGYMIYEDKKFIWKDLDGNIVSI
ncbi:MAG: phosphodiesterase [Clostridiales bacterium]|nr:phosphodiesterase [Clostridiales bacterium]